MKNLIYIIVLMLFTSCLSIKPANNINKAENKVIKFNEGIKNQVDKYPSLISKAFKVIVKDTIYIEGDSAEFDVDLFNIDSLVKLNKDYQTVVNYKQKQIDSLLSIPLSEYPDTCQYIVDELNQRIEILKDNNKQFQKESRIWFDSYTDLITKKTSGTYEDNIFRINYNYQNGNIKIEPSVKPSYRIVDKEEYNYNVKIRKNFYQDWKFYPFLLIIITLFYFFGDIIFGIIKKVVSLVRKLIFKI